MTHGSMAMFGPGLLWWTAAAATLSLATLVSVSVSVDAYLALSAAALALTLAVIVSIVQIERPFLGLSVLIVTAVAFPIEFPGPAAGMVSLSFPLAALFCGLWLLRLIVRRASVIDGSRVVYAAVVFMIVTCVSFVMGQFPWYASGGAPLPAQIAELGLFLVSGCLFLAVGHQLQSVREVKRLTWLLVGAGVVTALVQTIPGLAPIGQLTTRPGSVGSLFWTWLVAATASQALLNRGLPLPVRTCHLGISALVLFHGLFQVRSWVSGWLPPLVALCTILLFRFPRLGLGAAVVVLPVGLLLSASLSDALLAEEAYSLMTRQEAWSVLQELVGRSPLFGMGPAQYYYYTENIDILGWYVRFISHNNYEDLLLQTGLAGLCAFLWFAVEALLMLVVLHRRLADPFSRAFVVGAIGGLAGSMASGMLGDWIIPFYYNAGILGFRSSLIFWVFLGGALALKRMNSPARVIEPSLPAPAVACPA